MEYVTAVSDYTLQGPILATAVLSVAVSLRRLFTTRAYHCDALRAIETGQKRARASSDV